LKDLSDNAMRFWLACFMNPKSTLSFGGDHAEMAITPEARAALDELLAAGAVKPIPPTDQWPGREYYGAGSLDLRPELRSRPHLNPFEDTDRMILFAKIRQTAEAAPEGPDL
jgi:hypothetical protein